MSINDEKKDIWTPKGYLVTFKWENGKKKILYAETKQFVCVVKPNTSKWKENGIDYKVDAEGFGVEDGTYDYSIPSEAAKKNFENSFPEVRKKGAKRATVAKKAAKGSFDVLDFLDGSSDEEEEDPKDPPLSEYMTLVLDLASEFRARVKQLESPFTAKTMERLFDDKAFLDKERFNTGLDDFLYCVRNLLEEGAWTSDMGADKQRLQDKLDAAAAAVEY